MNQVWQREKIKNADQGKVEYINVKFNYGEGNETISDVNLNAAPGQTMALVGPARAVKQRSSTY